MTQRETHMETCDLTQHAGKLTYHLPADVAYVCGAGALVVWMVWSVLFLPLFEYAPHEDFWEHAAAIKEWSRQLSRPENPHLVSEAGSPRYTPFSLVFSAGARICDIRAIEALETAAVLNILILIAGVFLFARAYFQKEWAPLVMLCVMLGSWGLGFRHASEYQLRTLFYVAPYPSVFALGLTLISLWLTIRIVRGEVSIWWSTALLAVLLAVCLLSHPMTGAFMAGAIAVLSATEAAASWHHRMMPIIALIGGMLATELWPMFSLREILFGIRGVEGIWGLWWEMKPFGDLGEAEEPLQNSPFYQPLRVSMALGPALIGIPCLLYLAFKRQQAFIVYGFLMMIIPYAINLLSPIPEGVRFLYFAVFFLHMTLVSAVLRLRDYTKESMGSGNFALRKVLLGAGGIFLGGSLTWNLAYAAGHFVYTYFRKEPVTLVMKRLDAFIKEDSVVLAPPRVAWPIPSFEGKVVSLLHFNPMVLDQGQREEDTFTFFRAMTPDATRVRILERYMVSHVLYESAGVSPPVRSFLERVGKKIASVDGYCDLNNVEDISHNWKNIFLPCQRNRLELVKIAQIRLTKELILAPELSRLDVSAREGNRENARMLIRTGAKHLQNNNGLSPDHLDTTR